MAGVATGASWGRAAGAVVIPVGQRALLASGNVVDGQGMGAGGRALGAGFRGRMWAAGWRRWGGDRGAGGGQ